jgi:hypothetical protein
LLDKARLYAYILPCLQDQSSIPQDKQLQQEKTFYLASETGIPGLILIPEFITSEEEELLLSSLDEVKEIKDITTQSKNLDYLKEYSNSMLPATGSSSIAPGIWERVSKRRAQHFGFRFDYAVWDGFTL